MAWGYTKTMLCVGVGQLVVRAAATWFIDREPFSSPGIFWPGVTALPFLLFFGLLFDAVSWVRYRRSVARGRTGAPGIAAHPPQPSGRREVR